MNGRRLEEVTGRRTETVEWGAKQLWGDAALGHKAAHIQECSNEQHARAVVYNPQRRHYIMPPLVLVRRTVVTYTTTWEIVPGDPPIRTNMRPQDGWTWERALAIVPPAPGDQAVKHPPADDTRLELF
jgi:hypothetical protein